MTVFLSIDTVLGWSPDALDLVGDALLACRSTLLGLQDELDDANPTVAWPSGTAADYARTEHLRLGNDLGDLVVEVSMVLRAVDLAPSTASARAPSGTYPRTWRSPAPTPTTPRTPFAWRTTRRSASAATCPPSSTRTHEPWLSTVRASAAGHLFPLSSAGRPTYGSSCRVQRPGNRAGTSRGGPMSEIADGSDPLVLDEGRGAGDVISLPLPWTH